MRFASLLLLLLLPCLPAAAQTACPAAPLQRLAAPALRASLEAGGPVTIVAFGSSSTSGHGASGPAQTYPARLEAALRAAWPGVELRVVNRGIGGQDVEEMLARLDAHVLAERPQLVVWQAGANGAMRGMDPERFRALVSQGIARIRASGADVVLMDNQRAPRIDGSPRHAAFDAALAALAAEHGVGLFSRGALMRRWEAEGVPPAALLLGDGLHHNDRGYACVAEALAAALLRGSAQLTRR